MPEVPPYSSTTTAIWKPPSRSCRSSGSSRIVSGTTRRSDMSAETGHVLAPLVRHRHRLLDVHDAVDVVPVVAEHGEPRVAGAPRQPQHVVGRLVTVDAGAAHARRHDVVGRALAEAERAGEHPRGRDVERARLGRALHEARELLRRARARQLLLRLDADGAQEAVGRAVEHEDERLGDRREDRTGSATTFAVVERRGDAEELREQLAEDHRERGGQHEGEGARDGVDRSGCASPRLLSGPARRRPIEGCGRQPTTRVVMVMPTWAADSWVESCLSDWSTIRAWPSPSSMARWTVGRSRATSENSAATKTAVPPVSSTAASSSSHSVTAHRHRSACSVARSPRPLYGPVTALGGGVVELDAHQQLPFVA